MWKIKIRDTLLFILLSLVLGAAAGAVVWGVLKIMAAGIWLMWDVLPAAAGAGNGAAHTVYCFAVCGAGGVIIGLFQKKFGIWPETLETVMGKLKKNGTYPYDRMPNAYHGLTVLCMLIIPVQRKIAQNTSMPYLTYLSAASALSGILKRGCIVFPEMNQRKSPMAPKLQKKPQKNLPNNIVTGTVIMIVQNGSSSAAQVMLPLRSVFTIVPNAVNVLAKSPGMSMNDASCMALLASRAAGILFFFLLMLFSICCSYAL
jgi:hypothetical protein